MEVVTFDKGQYVSNIGQPAEVFYIMREGEARSETVIEMEKNFKYPIENEQWQIKKSTKVLKY